MEDTTIRTVTMKLFSHHVSADSMARIIDTFVGDCLKRGERVEQVDSESPQDGSGIVVITFTIKDMKS